MCSNQTFLPFLLEGENIIPMIIRSVKKKFLWNENFSTNFYSVSYGVASFPPPPQHFPGPPPLPPQKKGVLLPPPPKTLKKNF